MATSSVAVLALAERRPTGHQRDKSEHDDPPDKSVNIQTPTIKAPIAL
jgi:hypothetical protein